MRWPKNRYRPSKSIYKKLAEKISKKSNSESFVSGSMLFLAFLIFLTPIIIILLVSIGSKFGLNTIPITLLLIVATFSIFQAYNGIVRKKVRLIPKDPINRKETAYVGGNTDWIVKGKTARITGVIFLIIGLVCLARAVWITIGFL